MTSLRSSKSVRACVGARQVITWKCRSWMRTIKLSHDCRLEFVFGIDSYGSWPHVRHAGVLSGRAH
eukprot:465350-Pleurochrysis_carterae.AAC.1